jgi:hypothetical protein
MKIQENKELKIDAGLNIIFMFPAYRQAGVRNERSIELMKICTSIVPYRTIQSLLSDISTNLFSLLEIFKQFPVASSLNNWLIFIILGKYQNK